jgi:uncharacterized protein DUF4232
MRRTTTLLLSTIAGLMVLVFAAAGAVVVHAAPDACGRNQLGVRSGGSEGAAGTIYGVWVFTNVSSRTCTLDGYPSLQLYGLRGRPIRTTVREDLAPDPVTVTLHPGRSASFRTSYNEVAVPRCPRSAVMAVTPPNATTSLFIPAVLTPCRGVVHVSGVQAGVLGTS